MLSQTLLKRKGQQGRLLTITYNENYPLYVEVARPPSSHLTSLVPKEVRLVALKLIANDMEIRKLNHKDKQILYAYRQSEEAILILAVRQLNKVVNEPPRCALSLVDLKSNGFY